MRRLIPPEGDLKSKIAIIGEAPGKEEELQGKPFVGTSGTLLNTLLIHAGIRRDECYLTNVFKSQITKKKSGQDTLFFMNGEIVYTERKGFTRVGQKNVDELIIELKNVEANILVPMGNPALLAILDTTGVTEKRGSIEWCEKLNRKTIACLHPARVLRQYIWRNILLLDLKKVKEQSEFPELKRKPITFNQGKAFAESFLYYKEALKEILEKATLVSYDIEVVQEEVSCISFAWKEDQAIVIPFKYKGNLYFTPPQEQEIWEWIAKILETERIIKVGQNLAFDASFLYQKYGIVTKRPHDTMIAHRIAYPDLPSSLAFINSNYTDFAYYKEDGKKYFGFAQSDDKFLEYNARDSLVCQIAYPKLLEDLTKFHNLETYESQTKLIPPTVFMGMRGLKVDYEGMAKEKIEIESQIETLQAELNKIIGAELNVRSTKQLQTYFYVKKGLKPYQLKGKPTMNEKALKKISQKGFVEAKIALELRQLQNKISKYFEVNLRDGRLVCTYNPEAKTGRLKSSQDIFGFGTNMMNQPKYMNKYFCADEGYIIYSCDLAQADNRTVAYIAPEPKMIQAFEKGLDVHAITASGLFNLPVDEIIQMNKEEVKAPIGYGDQTHRYWGKKANHSLNYGLGYKKFAAELEIPEHEGNKLVEGYHKTYPGIRQGFHRWIQRELSKNRMLKNPFGRHYLFLDRWDEELFKQAYAFIPQSTTADIINRWGLNYLYYSPGFEKVELLRQVHDSIDFQIPISAGVAYHALVIEKLVKSLEQTITWGIYEYSIPVDFKVGVRLSPMKNLKTREPLIPQLQSYFRDANAE